MEVIDLKDVWRVQLINGNLLDPYDAKIMIEWQVVESKDILCFWRAKGYSTMIMLNSTVLIQKTI